MFLFVDNKIQKLCFEVVLVFFVSGILTRSARYPFFESTRGVFVCQDCSEKYLRIALLPWQKCVNTSAGMRNYRS